MAYLSKEDQAAASKRHYEANKEKIKARSKARNVRQALVLKAIVAAAKQRPCVDCGRSFPSRAMDLHHVRGDKFFNIADVVGSGMSEARLSAEIAKCVVLCAVCHRLRH